MSTTNDKRPGFGGRGEHLVAIQFALMIGFALLPVWHPGIGQGFMDSALLKTVSICHRCPYKLFGKLSCISLR